MLVGLIADTHGLLRPEVVEAFADVEHILHAGDVGSPDVLVGLRAIAPVTAVRGNIDAGDSASVARAELRDGEANVVLVPL